MFYKQECPIIYQGTNMITLQQSLQADVLLCSPACPFNSNPWLRGSRDESTIPS